MAPMVDKRVVAAELAVSVRTVEKWARRPGFPSFKLGRIRRYSVADVLAWFERGGSTSRAKPPIEADARAVDLLVRQAQAAGYRTEGVALRTLADRVGASSAIASTLAAQVRQLVAGRV